MAEFKFYRWPRSRTQRFRKEIRLWWINWGVFFSSSQNGSMSWVSWLLSIDNENQTLLQKTKKNNIYQAMITCLSFHFLSYLFSISIIEWNVYSATIRLCDVNIINLTSTFFSFWFCFCCYLQVCTLLYIAHIMIHVMWKYKIDPDNSAIPFLTALGDLFGSCLLAVAFAFMISIGKPYMDIDEIDSSTTQIPITVWGE